MRSGSTETELSECFRRCEGIVRVPEEFYIKVTERICTQVCACVLCNRGCSLDWSQSHFLQSEAHEGKLTLFQFFAVVVQLPVKTTVHIKST